MPTVVRSQSVHRAVVSGPQPDVAFPHAVFAHGRERRALQGFEQPDLDVVAAGLQADAGLRLDAGEAHIEGVAGIEAVDRAPVGLAELVAVDGIVEEVGEVVEEAERRADHIGVGLALAVSRSDCAQLPDSEKRLEVPPSVGSSEPKRLIKP